MLDIVFHLHLLGCVLTADLSITEQRQQMYADSRFSESVLKYLWFGYSPNQAYKKKKNKKHPIFNSKSCSTSWSLVYHAQNSQVLSSSVHETAPYQCMEREKSGTWGHLVGQGLQSYAKALSNTASSSFFKRSQHYCFFFVIWLHIPHAWYVGKCHTFPSSKPM